jgi:hypothetical protein
MYPKEAKASVWSYAINTRPCPRVSPGTISEPYHSMLRELWVFVFPIILVYFDTEDFGMTMNWNGVVRPHV